jgi:hypothetical protein
MADNAGSIPSASGRGLQGSSTRRRFAYRRKGGVERRRMEAGLNFDIFDDQMAFLEFQVAAATVSAVRSNEGGN